VRATDVVLVGAATAAPCGQPERPWWMFMVGPRSPLRSPDAWLLVLALAALVGSGVLGMRRRPLPGTGMCGRVTPGARSARQTGGCSAAALVAIDGSHGIAGLLRGRRSTPGLGGLAVVAGAGCSPSELSAGRSVRARTLEDGADDARLGIDLLADGELDRPCTAQLPTGSTR
jgi:hypothetical protein